MLENSTLVFCQKISVNLLEEVLTTILNTVIGWPLLKAHLQEKIIHFPLLQTTYVFTGLTNK